MLLEYARSLGSVQCLVQL